MSIEERWFRKLSEDFLIMRRMISAYRSLLRSRQQLENKCKALSEAEKHALKPAIKALENQMDEMAKQIAEEAGRRYPAYNNLVEVLGIDGNLQAMEALAELMTYIDTQPIHGRKFVTTSVYGKGIGKTATTSPRQLDKHLKDSQ
jgi:hypothetical protein